MACLYERESGKKIAPYYYVKKRSDTQQLEDKCRRPEERSFLMDVSGGKASQHELLLRENSLSFYESTTYQ